MFFGDWISWETVVLLFCLAKCAHLQSGPLLSSSLGVTAPCHFKTCAFTCSKWHSVAGSAHHGVFHVGSVVAGTVLWSNHSNKTERKVQLYLLYLSSVFCCFCPFPTQNGRTFLPRTSPLCSLCFRIAASK